MYDKYAETLYGFGKAMKEMKVKERTDKMIGYFLYTVVYVLLFLGTPFILMAS